MRELGLTKAASIIVVGAALALGGCKQRGAGAVIVGVEPAKADAGGSSTNVEAAIYDERTTSITVGAGERFVVALPGSTATPFEWRLAAASTSTSSSILRNVDEGYAEPESTCDGCGGSKGAFRFTFAAQSRGSAELHFVYVRVGTPSSSDGATRDVKIAVTVH